MLRHKRPWRKSTLSECSCRNMQYTKKTKILCIVLYCKILLCFRVVEFSSKILFLSKQYAVVSLHLAVSFQLAAINSVDCYCCCCSYCCGLRFGHSASALSQSRIAVKSSLNRVGSVDSRFMYVTLRWSQHKVNLKVKMSSSQSESKVPLVDFEIPPSPPSPPPSSSSSPSLSKSSCPCDSRTAKRGRVSVVTAWTVCGLACLLTAWTAVLYWTQLSQLRADLDSLRRDFQDVTRLTADNIDSALQQVTCRVCSHGGNVPVLRCKE